MEQQPLFDKQVNVSLRERVTNEIRRAILTGKLRPGSRIKEADIAEQMGVSRGPVRESIRQLEREGLLVSQPYKETLVASMNYEEVRDILLPIRFHLEWNVIKKYIVPMPADSPYFAELQMIVDQFGLPSREEHADRLVELDMAFHEKIVSLAAERTVALTWKSISNQLALHFYFNLPHYEAGKFQQDHQELLDVMKAGDLEAIRNALMAHIAGEGSFLYFA
ncbi:MAG: GntR family transcriptional regulator [Paenibacillaceae bacterium]|nr:GntR family transcriptional regulator [Paenibacillaceae bacterium]